jgi:BMFP domain-containing protein YqiC
MPLQDLITPTQAKMASVTREEENAAIAKLKKLEAEAEKKQAEQKKDPAPKK